MLTESKCRRRSTLVERNVESPDTFWRNRNLTKQISSVFNSLARSWLGHVFGSRSAVFPSVDGDQPPEESQKMSINTGCQRDFIPGLIYSLKGRSEDDGDMAHSIHCVKGETNGHCRKIPH